MGTGELLKFLLALLKRLQELPDEKARAKVARVISCLQDDDE